MGLISRAPWKAAVCATNPTQMAYPKADLLCRGRRMGKVGRSSERREVHGAHSGLFGPDLRFINTDGVDLGA